MTNIKTRELPLHAIAHARAGDKGNVSNISLIAYLPEAYDFLKRYSVIKMTKSGIERLGLSVINLAEYENLEGHANSIKIRLKNFHYMMS